MSKRGVGLALIAAATGCSLLTDLSGLAKDEAGSSSGGPEGGLSQSGPGGSFEGGPDAIKAEPLATGGVVVARGASEYAAGAAQQHHAHFANNLGAWVFFYLPAGRKNVLATRLSADLATFVDGPTLALPRPHDGDGRNFDVAYADIGGADVFHIAISMRHGNVRYSYRARGRGAGGTIAFDAPSELGHTDDKVNALDPDGPSVAILGSRRVVVSSGFNELEPSHTGNFVTFTSNKPDDGAADWDHAFGPGVEAAVAQRTVNARSVGARGDECFGVWESGDADPRPTRVHFAVFNGTTWGAGSDASFSTAAYDVNDLGGAVTSDGRVHAIRYGANGYEHRFYDTVGRPGFALPTAAQSEGDGLVLLALGDVATVVTLGAGDKPIRRTRLIGDRWGDWEQVAVPDAARRHLSGATTARGAVVLWERERDGASDLVALPLP